MSAANILMPPADLTAFVAAIIRAGVHQDGPFST